MKAEADLEQMRANLVAKEEAVAKAKAVENEALESANQKYSDLQVAHQAGLGVPHLEFPATPDVEMTNGGPAGANSQRQAEPPRGATTAKKQKKPPTDEEEEAFFSETSMR